MLEICHTLQVYCKFLCHIPSENNHIICSSVEDAGDKSMCACMSSLALRFLDPRCGGGLILVQKYITLVEK